MNYLEITYYVYKEAAVALATLGKNDIFISESTIITMEEDVVKLGCHSCESRNLQIDV